MQRRTRAERTVIWGTARADVRSLDIITPRDTRTVQLSGPGHAFITVYDGPLYGGATRAVAHLRSGATKRIKLYGP